MSDRATVSRSGPLHWSDRLLAHFRRRRWRGFSRLYKLLRGRAGPYGLCAATRYGSRFFLNPWDYVDGYVIDEGFYESEVLEAVRPGLTDGSVLWVIGANFGLHAITAKFLHPAARVLAFEPLPSMGARFLENCELNGVTVELNAYALSDRVDLLPFFANTSGNPAMSTLHPNPEGTYNLRINVATTTAEEVVRGGRAPPPTAAILDAEGAETSILRGFGPLLQQPGLRLIVFEAGINLLAEQPPSELLQILLAAGFRIEPLARQEKTGHTLSNFAARRFP